MEQFKKIISYVLISIGILLPIPTPFSDIQGYENFSSMITLDITTASGKILTTDIGREHFKNLRGPHKRKVVYINALTHLPRIYDKTAVSTILYGFCNNGPLAKEGLNLSEPIRSLIITVTTRTEGRSGSWRFPFICSS